MDQKLCKEGRRFRIGRRKVRSPLHHGKHRESTCKVRIRRSSEGKARIRLARGKSVQAGRLVMFSLRQKLGFLGALERIRSLSQTKVDQRHTVRRGERGRIFLGKRIAQTRS